jgi:hypothetical protein
MKMVIKESKIMTLDECPPTLKAIASQMLRHQQFYFVVLNGENVRIVKGETK